MGQFVKNKKDWYSIPNILSLIRLALIPVFIFFYYRACAEESLSAYYSAGVIVIVSGITDFLDGFIARKFNMITELGKFLDPLADKLTQGALFFCIAYRHSFMWVLFGIWVLKDGFMAVMGLTLLKKKNKKLGGANWYGKVCTAVIYLGVLALIFFPTEFPPDALSTLILILICVGIMAMSGILYGIVLVNMWIHNETVAKSKKNNKNKNESAYDGDGAGESADTPTNVAADTESVASTANVPTE